MKKIVYPFILLLLVIITSGLWFSYSSETFSLKKMSPFLFLIFVIGFAVFIGIKHLLSFKKGKPIEDELSKRTLVKASSISFYVSIYLWLFIMYYSDKTEIESHTIIGMGILGMSIIFAIAWAVTYFGGIKNE